MKRAPFGVVLFTLILGIYLFWSDFGLVKKFFGYNVPAITTPPVVSPDLNDKDGLGFLSVPDGFRISVAVRGLTNPRVILFDSKGRILVSETKAGRVRNPRPSLSFKSGLTT